MKDLCLTKYISANDRPVSSARYVDVRDGQLDFLEVLLVMQSIDVVDTVHIEWVVVWIVRTCDSTARLMFTENHLITF